MKKKAPIFLLICYLIGNGCFGAVTAGSALTVDGNDIKTVIAGNTDFAFVLYDRLKNDPNATASNGNLFFSPYSISTALAMAYGGARGQTQKQISAALHFTLPDEQLYPAFGTLQKQLILSEKSSGCQLLMADALWLQKGYPFLKEFLDLTASFDAGRYQLDFIHEAETSRKTINSWVEEKTNTKIKDLLPPGSVDNQTVLVLTNAIYFKGEWKTKFSWWKTHKADFAVSAKDKVNIPLMHLKEKFKYYSNENLQRLNCLIKAMK
jgi:serpin B